MLIRKVLHSNPNPSCLLGPIDFESAFGFLLAPHWGGGGGNCPPGEPLAVNSKNMFEHNKWLGGPWSNWKKSKGGQRVVVGTVGQLFRA